MSKEDLKAMQEELAKLKAENAKLKEENRPKLGLKVSDKGAVSLYGIRRFPVTFYKSEWTKILDKGDDIRKFMVEHDSELASKGDSTSRAEVTIPAPNTEQSANA